MKIPTIINLYRQILRYGYRYYSYQGYIYYDGHCVGYDSDISTYFNGAVPIAYFIDQR